MHKPLNEKDFGTPRRTSDREVTLETRWYAGHRSSRHFHHARSLRRWRERAQTLRDGQSGTVRLMPFVPGRDRGAPRLPRLMHDALSSPA